jgi:hypothetical protein
MSLITIDITLNNSIQADILPEEISADVSLQGATVQETVPSQAGITLTAGAGHKHIQWRNIDAGRVIDSIDLTNVASYKIYVKSVEKTSFPITLDPFDLINITFTPTDSDQVCTFVLNDESVQDTDFTFIQPKVDTTRHHICVLVRSAINGGTNYFEIIDCATNTVVKERTLPALGSSSNINHWAGPAFDNDRDYWVFGCREYWAFVQADPDHTDFGEIIDPATGNASAGHTEIFIRGDSYAWYNFLYDPFYNASGSYQQNRRGLILMNNDSYAFGRHYDCRNYGNQYVAATSPGRVYSTGNDGVYYWLPNGDLACIPRAGSVEIWRRFKNNVNNNSGDANFRPIAGTGFGGGAFSSGYAFYAANINKFFGGTHQFLRRSTEDLRVTKTIKTMAGGGTSAFYQCSGGWAYDPVNNYALWGHYWRQTDTFDRVYAIDLVSEVVQGDYEIPNINATYTTAPRHFPQMIYCPYNGKIYQSLMSYGISTNGAGGLNVYDISNWLANGRDSLSSLNTAFIPFTQTAGYGWNSAKYDTFHKHMAGNWIDLPHI